MYREALDHVSNDALKKVNFLNHNRWGYFISAALAGFYVGIGVILAYSVAGPFYEAESPAVKLLLGTSFGIALILVIFAGAELFTGANFVMPVGYMDKKVTFYDIFKIWTICYIGNFVGAILLSLLFVSSGLAVGSFSAIVTYFAELKISVPFWQLFFRGILCNLLVCLAVWMSTRAKDDTAKIILIGWSLFAFVSSGFEHSVANMTLLTIDVLLSQNSVAAELMGMLHNLIPVTLGNIVGGVVLGLAYEMLYLKKK